MCIGAVQQAGPVFTVQWLPSRGAPLDGLPGQLLQVLEGRWGSGQPWASPWHREPSRSRGQGGPPLAAWHQHCQWRAVGAAGKPSHPGFWAARISRKPADAFPPRQSQASLRDLCLLVGAGTHPWAQGFFHSSAPTLLSTATASGSLPRCWLEGAGGGQRVVLGAHQPPPSRWEPPGPTINISSTRHPPALSESVQSLGVEGGGASPAALASSWLAGPQGGQATFPEGWRRRRVDAP